MGVASQPVVNEWMDVGRIQILRDVDARWLNGPVYVFSVSQVSSLISGRRRPRWWEGKTPESFSFLFFYIPANISKHTAHCTSYRLQMGINQLGCICKKPGIDRGIMYFPKTLSCYCFQVISSQGSHEIKQKHSRKAVAKASHCNPKIRSTTGTIGYSQKLDPVTLERGKIRRSSKKPAYQGYIMETLRPEGISKIRWETRHSNIENILVQLVLGRAPQCRRGLRSSNGKIRRHRGSKYEIHSENRVQGANDLAGSVYGYKVPDKRHII